MFSQDFIDSVANGPYTELCTIMNKTGSDKGSGHHNYTKFYDHLWKFRRNESLNILEFGVGSIDPNILSNMRGVHDYKPGASQRGWREYFPNATIYACDIDQSILEFEDPCIKGYYVDQTNLLTVTDLFFNGDLKDVQFDIIIDDGLHHFPTNMNLMCTLMPKLKPDGVYIIEDILRYEYQSPKKIPFCKNSFQYITIPNPRNNVDNNIFVAYKEENL